MRFVKHAVDIPIRNLDEFASNNKNKEKRHGPLLPNNLRCIIAGPSGCGKTNLLISLIESENGLKFENLYIYSKTLGQEKYQYLEHMLSPIKGVGYHTFSSTDDVIPPNEAKRNSVFIFDDMICDKDQTSARNLFCMGRHYQADVIYLTQTFTKLSKHLIRDNCNFLILFKQDDMNLKHAYEDFGVNCDMKFDEFKKFCLESWREKYGFIIIDLESEPNSGRYRRKFSEFLQVYKNDNKP